MDGTVQVGSAQELGPVRIAVDVGGTFTDLVVSDQDGRLRTFKAPSTPTDPSRAVFDALDLEAGRAGVLGTPLRRGSGRGRHVSPSPTCRDTGPGRAGR